MSIYVNTFTVRGTGALPLDMLRRDKCYPKNEADAVVAQHGGGPLLREVTLEHVSAAAHWTPNAARWRSFGWEVVAWEVEDPRGRTRHLVSKEA